MNARSPRVLAVEDNPITRRLLRASLIPEGFELIEASDGATALRLMAVQPPDIALVDLVLSDMDGYQLVRLLRSLPTGREVPILAFSGFLTEHDESRLAAAGFDDLITKPLEPETVVRTLRSHLPKAHPSDAQPFGRGRRLLLVDDDPVQLKLGRVLLSHAGFEVTAASDGEEALAAARRQPPDIIVTDALMPRLDGFGLCIAARRDARLASLPIIVATSSYLDEADRDLARQAGADAFVVRTPDLRDVIAAVRTRLSDETTARAVRDDGNDGVMELERARRAMHQLDRQVALNSRLRRQSSMLGAQLSVIGAISDALVNSRDADLTVQDVLATCLDAIGASSGAIVLGSTAGTLSIYAAHGLDATARERLVRALSERAGVRTAPAPSSGEFAVDLGLRSGPALVLPLGTGHRARPGVVVVAGQPAHATDEEWRSFARAIASQVGAALALAQAFGRLSASEARQRALMESAEDAIFVISADRLILEANGGAVRLLGRPRTEIVGRPISDFVAEEDREPARAFTEQPRGSRASRWLDMNMIRADRSRITVEITHSDVDIEGEMLSLVIVRDTTERHALAARLRESQKIEAIGRLAGGIAHDFNNLLAVITSYGDLMLEELPLDSTSVRDDLEQIRHAAASAATLTRQLLAFSRRQVLKPTRLDVNSTLAGIEKILGRLAGPAVTFTTSLASDLWPILADPGQLEQVLMNLTANARDAMPRGGAITITTSNVVVDSGPDKDIPPGEYVCLAVTDTGTGMDAATRQRIFEPFFTTKELGKGTGLGLATVYGIVEQSGGRIRVDSEIGRGTTFRIYFPRTTLPATDEPTPSRPPPSPARSRSARILLVEDEPQLRAAIQRILTDHGHRVSVVADGNEALALAAAEPTSMDLLITDLVMPTIGGVELAKRLASRWPAIQTLFMSGHTGGGDAATLRATSPFLQKPFTPAALIRAVQDVLRGVGPRLDSASASAPGTANQDDHSNA